MKILKTLKKIMGTLLVLVSLPVTAGHSNNANTSGFAFSYNVGAVSNYHAYGLACQVGIVSPQPPGTVTLGFWWVWDLGAATGTGSVVCPKPITPKGQHASDVGILFFADAGDIGGQPFTHPVGDVQVLTDGNAFVGIIEPDGTGTTLYFGPKFSPYAWDLSPYLW